MQRQGMVPNTATYTALISNLEKGGQPEGAFEVAQAMWRQGVTPDVMTYNALFNACGKVNKRELAMEMFKTMRKQGTVPNADTFAAFLSAWRGITPPGQILAILQTMRQHVALQAIALSMGGYLQILRLQLSSQHRFKLLRSELLNSTEKVVVLVAKDRAGRIIFNDVTVFGDNETMDFNGLAESASRTSLGTLLRRALYRSCDAEFRLLNVFLSKISSISARRIPGAVTADLWSNRPLGLSGTRLVKWLRHQLPWLRLDVCVGPDALVDTESVSSRKHVRGYLANDLSLLTYLARYHGRFTGCSGASILDSVHESIMNSLSTNCTTAIHSSRPDIDLPHPGPKRGCCNSTSDVTPAPGSTFWPPLPKSNGGLHGTFEDSKPLVLNTTSWRNVAWKNARGSGEDSAHL